MKETERISAHDLADYIIVKLDEAKDSLSLLKLQKLAYYAQAWRLALKDERLFEGRFQAWVRGPVNRQLYDRLSTTRMMHGLLGPSAVRSTFNLEAMPKDVREHIDEVLEAYAGFSGPQLEELVRGEAPWIQARGDCRPSECCEVEIDETLIGSFYRKLLEDAGA